MPDLLRLEDLRVSFPGPSGSVLNGLDLSVAAGEAVALVGPSGSGKSLTARAALGLLPPGARWRGRIRWRGEMMTDPAGPAWRGIRGRGMALVLQEPLAALDPVRTVGDQIAETVRHHRGLGSADARRRAVALLGEMMVPDPERVAASHPHRLSGGQRQRALVAAALACDPDLLIADEPTTALDVLVQAGILAAIDRVRRDRGMALLFISHDRDVVAGVADRVVGLRDGRAVDPGPRPGDRPPAAPHDGKETVLGARGLVVDFGRGRRRIRALEGVDLDLGAGESLGVAGRTGCGKTTLSRVLTGHLKPAAGRVVLAGEELYAGSARERRRRRRRTQLLFQDPGSSLDPRQRIGPALAEAGAADPAALLAEVGLERPTADRHPHQLSGGQRQRVALARCLATGPAVIVADEPTSALDHEAQDRILTLLAEVRRAHGLGQVIVSHDLAVLSRWCGRIAVMLDGLIVEVFRPAEGPPRHPYARRLWEASPAFGTGFGRAAEVGAPSRGESRLAKIGGCPYAVDCELWKPSCSKELPLLVESADGRLLRCPEAGDHPTPQFIDT